MPHISSTNILSLINKYSRKLIDGDIMACYMPSGVSNSQFSQAWNEHHRTYPPLCVQVTVADHMQTRRDVTSQHQPNTTRVCLSACLSVCPLVCLSAVSPSVCLSVCLSACLSVHLSVCPLVCLSAVSPSVCLFVCPPVCLCSRMIGIWHLQILGAMN